MNDIPIIDKDDTDIVFATAPDGTQVPVSGFLKELWDYHDEDSNLKYNLAIRIRFGPWFEDIEDEAYQAILAEQAQGIASTLTLSYQNNVVTMGPCD